MRLALGCLVVVSALQGGCRARGEEKSATLAAPSASSVSGVFSVPPPVNPRTEAIPTEQDFEEEAIRDIQPANLEAELDRLRKEIRP